MLYLLAIMDLTLTFFFSISNPQAAGGGGTLGSDVTLNLVGVFVIV